MSIPVLMMLTGFYTTTLGISMLDQVVSVNAATLTAAEVPTR
jgi:hypothetical protein